MQIVNSSRPKTVLCIPGKWQDRTEIVQAIAGKNSNKYLFAGRILMNIQSKESFELEIAEQDERMRDSFKVAGMMNDLEESYLEELDQHRFVIYLIGETGNVKSAKAIAEAGLAILKAGGMGVKVESTGKAFTKEKWTDLVEDFEESNLYEMFVLEAISDGEGTVYSCGMHNLGLKDAIVSQESLKEAMNLLSVFNYYQFAEQPEIRVNQTFSTAVEAPVFEISEENNQPNKGYELFENPFGMWRLKRIANIE